MEDLHDQTALSLANLLSTNKGLYIKLGQAIANQGELIPAKFYEKLRPLYDQAPVDSWEDVSAVLAECWGVGFEERLFENFDHEPIASGSIAQVHRATLKDSRQEVAVKVQHWGIRKQVRLDLWVYRVVARFYEKVFEVPLVFASPYILDQMKRETNFLHELENTQWFHQVCKTDPVMKRGNISAPDCFPSMCTPQVLVTEWVDGFPLTSGSVLKTNNLDPRTSVRQVTTMLGRQIFHLGKLHGDPHPGNFLARREGSKQQLVVLDHGLYVELPPEFSQDYRDLWQKLFVLDDKGVAAIAGKWGIKSPRIFATLILLRPSKSKGDGDEGPLTINSVFKSFMGDTDRFPLPLIFVGRSMRMIQNLNQSFGSPVNRVNILTRQLIQSETPKNWSQNWLRLRILVSLWTSALIFYIIRASQWLLRGDRRDGVEDFIDAYMQNTIREMGLATGK